MTQSSSMYQFDCKFRCNNNSPTVCKYQSVRMGHIVNTSPIFCNNSCPKHIYDNAEEDIEFLKKCYYRRYGPNFIDEVIIKHQKQTKLIVPNIWDDIQNIVYNILYRETWFQDLGLTGSIIVDGVSNHKDIDIVIAINDIDGYVDWIENHKLPNQINFIKTDYYIYTDAGNQFFTSLWPNQNKVYIDQTFEKNITIPENYTISYNNGINSKIFDIKK